MKKALKYAKANDPNGPDPVLSDFNPGTYAYATSEKFYQALTTTSDQPRWVSQG